MMIKKKREKKRSAITGDVKNLTRYWQFLYRRLSRLSSFALNLCSLLPLEDGYLFCYRFRIQEAKKINGQNETKVKRRHLTFKCSLYTIHTRGSFCGNTIPLIFYKARDFLNSQTLFNLIEKLYSQIIIKASVVV